MPTNYAVGLPGRMFMPALPTGTVTFLFSDIEGSTKLWEAYPDAMRVALARHDALLRQAIEDNNGYVFKTIGDAFCAAFTTAPDALSAALAAQQALQRELNHGEEGEYKGEGEPRQTTAQEAKAQTDPQSSSSPLSSLPVFPVVQLVLRVRMALHTGTAELRDSDYFGQPLNRVARLLGAAHGGQVLLSDVAHELTRDTLPTFAGLKSLGEHRLRDLGRPEPVFQLLHPDLPDTFAPLKSLDNPTLPNNLPQQVTSFIGREKEIEAVKTLLDKTRLLTLTGSGGNGKTRLSLQVAADVLENYADGVWLIELASLADPALVPQTMAQALSIPEEPGKPLAQTLVAALKDRKMLLVLDNCEHLLSACERLVDTLIRACPALKVLASSREGLGIAGETLYRIPSLSLPDLKHMATAASLGMYEAVRLFVDRAAAVLPDFVVTNQNAPALASVCHRLDGIPLAIELAAARVRSLSVEEINSKLDNRFRLLTGGSRTALPRQQTLRALIDWSYDLLTTQEKMLLCRLSVFVGGWTLAAAEQVGAGAKEIGEGIEDWEMLDLLTSLADKSLVFARTQGETTRYRLLETVRQYARDRLTESGESLTVRARHANCFLTLAEEARPKLRGLEQGQWLDVLEEEHDNLRQALTWYGEDLENAEAGEKGLRLGAALQQFWQTRGHVSEGRERLSALLAHPGGQKHTEARADALNGAGVLARMQGDYDEARVLSEEGLTIARELGDKSGIARSLLTLGTVALDQGDYDGARVQYEESLTIQRTLGSKWGIAASLLNLGIVALERSDYDGARVQYEESLTMFRELGDKSRIAISLGNLGNVATEQGDYVAARVLLEEGLTIRRELGDRSGIAFSLLNLGNVATEQGDYDGARVLLEEGLTLQRELGDKYSIAYSLSNLGNVAKARGDYDGARVLLEESLTIFRELGDKKGTAYTLSNLGIVALEQGDYAAAQACLREGLTLSRELGDKRVTSYALEGYAALARYRQQPARAVRLWSAAAVLRETIGCPLSPVEQEKQGRAITAARKTLSEDAFALAWTEGRTMTLEQATAYALKEDA